MRRLQTNGLWLASVALASVYVAAGLWTLLNPVAPEALAEWGVPEALGPLLGILEVGGGVLFLIPGAAHYSAGALAFLTGVATINRLWAGNAVEAILCATLLAAVASIGYLRHPRVFLMSRFKAAVDAFAEREIARERQQISLPRVSSLHDSSVIVP